VKGRGRVVALSGPERGIFQKTILKDGTESAPGEKRRREDRLGEETENAGGEVGGSESTQRMAGFVILKDPAKLGMSGWQKEGDSVELVEAKEMRSREREKAKLRKSNEVELG
jgi:hypothetical protein